MATVLELLHFLVAQEQLVLSRVSSLVAPKGRPFLGDESSWVVPHLDQLGGGGPNDL